MVDPDSVRAKLAILDHRVAKLEEIQAGGRDRFFTPEGESVRAEAERHLQLAEQACIDIGLHIAAEAGLNPTDYKDIFAKLSQAKLIDADLATWLQGAAGQRNVLVHAYDEVDDEKIWAALGELGRFVEFASAAQEIAAIG